MAKFKLTTPMHMDNDEVALQWQFGPPPTFKSIDDASDWAITNLPIGVYFELHDGRGTLRASGSASGKVQIHKIKERSDKGKPRYYCSGYGWCEIHGEHGP